MCPTALEITEYIEQIAPLESGVTGDIVGVLRAPEEDYAVSKVAVSWALPVDTLLEIRDWGAEMIILHEMPIYPNQQSPWYEPIAPGDVLPDMYRARIVEKWESPLLIYRAHSNWDARVPEGVPESFGRFIGLGEPVDGGKFTRVYEIEKTTLGELCDRVAEKMSSWTGSDRCPPRIFGDPEQEIVRVGVMIGGFGGNQFNMVEEFRNMDAEAVIVGDLVEVISMHALEIGIGVIETTHSFTEQPAMESLADMLASRFSDVEFKVFKSGAFPLKRVTVEQMTDVVEAFGARREENGGEDKAGMGGEEEENESLQESMREFKERFPQMWQRVELLMRIQRLQQQAGEEFPPERMMLHVISPHPRELMIKSIRAVDLASASVVLDVYEHREIQAGTVFVPLDMIGWIGSPNVIEHRVMGFTYTDVEKHKGAESESPASHSSIIKRISKVRTKRLRRRKTTDSNIDPNRPAPENSDENNIGDETE